MIKVCIWMNIPSHHQTAFFQALERRGDIDLRVVYLTGELGARIAEGWSSEHESLPFEAVVSEHESPLAAVELVPDWRDRIHIICESFSHELIRLFCREKVSWCHWSEVPGIRLARLLNYCLPLFNLLNPIMLLMKRYGEGQRIRRYAIGAFGQGMLAEQAFYRMGIPPEKFAELYYVPAPLPESDPCAQMVEFSRGRKVFLAVGAVGRRKGTDILLRAFAGLNASEWCLVICGLDRTGGRTQALAKRLGIESNVLFLGAYSADRISEVYAAADVSILASRFDGWGAVLNEAASLGLPLIGSSHCGSSWHIIKNGVNGFRVKAGSIKQLRKAMQVYVNTPQLLQSHGAFSRKLFSEAFTPDKNAARLVDALECWTGRFSRASETRVFVQQPALPKYRVPFFRELSERAGISLTLNYSSVDNELDNIVSTEFDLEFVPMWMMRVGGRHLMWHSAQWNGARRGACDVLVLSWDAQYISLIPALLRARHNRISTILWGHGYSKKEAWFRKLIRDGIARLADALVFYDFVTARKFIDSGWNPDMIHVAPNSLNQESIQRARSEWIDEPGRLERFQDEHALSDRTNILYIGRIYDDNRLDLLIKALPKIRAAVPGIQVLIIGKQNQSAAVLRKLADKLKVSDCIRWLGAIYDEQNIAPYMLSAKLFCYPANIGLSIMHAMGYGLPVLTGDNVASHNPEIHVLKNNETGALFKDGSSGSLADRIAELLNSPERLDALGDAARTAVLESFTIEKMADGFAGAIESVVQRRSK